MVLAFYSGWQSTHMKKRMNLEDYRGFYGINMTTVAKFTEQSLKKNYQE